MTRARRSAVALAGMTVVAALVYYVGFSIVVMIRDIGFVGPTIMRAASSTARPSLSQ